MHFDPSETYVRLTAGGSAELIADGEGFWSMPEPQLNDLSADPRRPPKVLHLWPPKLLHRGRVDLMH